MITMMKKSRELKKYRDDYYIKWNVKFMVDKGDCYTVYSVLPTVYFVAWYQRSHGESIIDITWWKYHICVGTWCKKEKKDEEV